MERSPKTQDGDYARRVRF